MNLLDLHKPYPAAEIEWRVGSTNSDKSSGLALAYLTARHVMERLDEVCGPENWQDRYEFHGSRTVCYLSIRIGDEWVTKADGAGDSDVEAEKGAISDALKRAAVKWGIGRYLYDLGNIWVDLEAAGRSVRIKRDQYAKLEKALFSKFGGGSATSPQPATPTAATVTKDASYYSAELKAQTKLEPLQAVFKELWRSDLSGADKQKLKDEYESRKIDVSANASFDKMENGQ